MGKGSGRGVAACLSYYSRVSSPLERQKGLVVCVLWSIDVRPSCGCSAEAPLIMSLPVTCYQGRKVYSNVSFLVFRELYEGNADVTQVVEEQVPT